MSLDQKRKKILRALADASGEALEDLLEHKRKQRVVKPTLRTSRKK